MKTPLYLRFSRILKHDARPHLALRNCDYFSFLLTCSDGCHLFFLCPVSGKRVCVYRLSLETFWNSVHLICFVTLERRKNEETKEIRVFKNSDLKVYSDFFIARVKAMFLKVFLCPRYKQNSRCFFK